LEAAVRAYVDESHARTLGVLPLRAPGWRTGQGPHGEALGALVVERFDAAADSAADRQRADLVQRHGVLALRHALWRQALPLSPLLLWWVEGSWFARVRRRPLAALSLLAGALLAAWLTLKPADFYIEARGQLQPKVRLDVFAPSDGVVHKVRVAHADRVSAGQVLVELRRSELDLEFARVLGEMQTTRAQLDSVAASRLRTERASAESRAEYEQLTAKEEELKKLLETLAAQYDILAEQRAQLTVGSPMDGQVLTWNVMRSLDGRPVRRGQVLMTVVAPDGPWVLELEVPDDQIGHVLAAQRQLGPRLDVSFILATDPAATQPGAIEQVAMEVRAEAGREASVLTTVAVDRDRIGRPRPGATATAKIHCGRRALGYVWFHDVIEALRSWWLF
jgi:multidrug efflux pump subunit AcrA (membrane-fusion protein)